MRIVTVALGSFMLGALCMFFFGNHTSTVLQPAFAQTKSAPPQAAPAPAQRNPFVPIIPPLSGNSDEGSRYANIPIDLDGLECFNCELDNVTLKYGGGAYALPASRIGGNINLQFVGPALNTIGFLHAFNLFPCQANTPIIPAEPINPNKPTVTTVKFEKQTSKDLASVLK